MSKILRPSAGYMGRGVMVQSAVEYMLYHQKSLAQVKPEPYRSLSFSQRRGPCTSLVDCFQNWISHMFRLYHPLPGMACSRGESPVT